MAWRRKRSVVDDATHGPQTRPIESKEVRATAFGLVSNSAKAAQDGPLAHPTQLQTAADCLNLRLNPGVLPVTRLNARLNAA